MSEAISLSLLARVTGGTRTDEPPASVRPLIEKANTSIFDPRQCVGGCHIVDGKIVPGFR